MRPRVVDTGAATLALAATAAAQQLCVVRALVVAHRSVAAMVGRVALGQQVAPAVCLQCGKPGWACGYRVFIELRSTSHQLRWADWSCMADERSAAPAQRDSVTQSASASSDSTHVLRLSASELLFNNVRPGVHYTRRLEVTNPLQAPIEISVKAGSSERYTVEPTSLTVGAQDTAAVLIRLRMNVLPSMRRGGTAAVSAGPTKDTFIIKSAPLCCQ